MRVPSNDDLHRPGPMDDPMAPRTAVGNDGERVDRLIRDVLDETGIHPGYRRTVRDMLRREDDQWRICCGSGCDPCVETLGRVVDSVRRRLASSS